MTTLSFEALWKDRGATAGLKNLAAGTKAARVSYDDLRTATVRAAGAMKNAQLNIADATRAVAIAEARLKEARESGKAKASAILALEDKLASARRREADATDAVKRASVGLTQAKEREQRALQKSSLASVAAAKALRGLGAGATFAAKGGIRALGDGASVASRSVGKITSVLGGLTAATVKYGAVAVAAGGVAAAGFGLKVASGNEQAKISFTTMLGSARRADKFLRQLQQFAAKTPFEFPELQTAASSLISVGIKADKVIPIMTSLGNATSGMGTGAEGVKRATVALQQMTAAGRITAEDLNQLRDAGVPVFELLTKATGKSAAAIAKMAAEGKLGKKELQQLMAALESGKGLERFAGLMDKQSRSLAGLASTFKDVAGQAFAGLATSAFPLIKSGLADMSTGLGHLSDWVKDNKDALGDVFKVVGSTLKTLGGTVMTVFTSFARSAGIGKGSFKDFADFLSTHQEDITRGIIGGAKAFISFGRTVATVASGGLRAFGTFADGISTATASILAMYANMAHGAALAFGWIPGIGPKLLAADVKFRIFAAHSATNIHKAGDAARTLADGIDNGVVPALDKAGHGLDVYGKKGIASAHAKDILAKAEIRHRDAANAATAAAKTNGKTLDSNTISGRANRTALNNLVGSSQNYIGKLIATHASSKRVTAATKDARAEFIRVAEKMGVSSARAKDLADKYFKIPKKASTKVEQPGMTKARGDTKDLDNKINNLNNKSVTITYKTNASSILTKYGVNIHASKSGQGSGGGLARGGVLPGFTPLSRGDDVPFPMAGGGIQPLRGGEGIAVSEVMRDPHERALLLAKNKAALRGESMARFRGMADGGILSRKIITRVLSPSNLDEIAGGFNRVGSGIAAAVGSGIAAAVKKRLDKAAKAAAAAGGGPIGSGGYASALGYARRHRGHPYVYASLWDCSGFMSALHSIILGQRPHRRYTTTAFHGAHAAGFTRGKRSPFMVGVRPLSGKFGHMAGTLNGVNVESSGGVGVRVGGGARGAHSGMFSWRGGLAKGGVIGDLPFDLLDPQGERYNPWLADLVHKAGYHRGGRIGGDGPERILSAPQNRAFEHLVRVMDRRGGGGAGTTIIINAPGGWIGSQDQFKQMLVDMNRRGQLEVIKR